jgi:gliding motility-associated-like protein
MKKTFTPLLFYKFGFAMLLLLMSNSMQAQIQVTNTGNASSAYDPITLISNVFIGQGMDIDTIIFEGNAQQVGYFQNGGTAIGINDGILITNGNAESAANPNTATNTTTQYNTTNTTSPLNNVVTGNINDIAQYTIVFTPTSSTLSFNYVFGSEEYPEWVGSAFNDVFGFFISGPNSMGPFTNIALVPGTTTPVSINTVNVGSNPTYYNTNGAALHEYDGYTTVMTATANVTPCQQYTIILAISDVGDFSLDSGVFLEAGSFVVDGIIASPITPSPDTVLIEGCASGVMEFNTVGQATTLTPITYSIGGTATMGIDYDTIPLSGIIPIGGTSFSFPIVPLNDGVLDGIEYIEFIFNTNPCTVDTVRIYIDDNELVTNIDDTFICTGDSVTLDATAPITIPPPYSFVDMDTVATIEYQAVQSTMGISGFPFPSVTAGMIESVCLDITHIASADLDIFLIAPDGKFLELSTDNGQILNNFGQICFVPDPSAPLIVGSPSPFSGNYQPEGPWNFLNGAPVNGTWTLQVTDDGFYFDGTINSWSINFASIYDIEYAWTPTTNINYVDSPIVVVNPTVTTDYVVSITDTYGCTFSDTATIFVDDQLPAPIITCGAATNTTIEFLWQAIPNAVSYEVNVNNTGWVPANGVLSHLATGLPPGTAIPIEVRAVQNVNSPCTLPPLIGSHICLTTTCALTTNIASQTNVSCFAGSDGAVTIAILAGIPPYSLTINGGLPTANTTFTNLAAGNYTIVITDSVGCNETQIATILDGIQITTAFATTDATCNGDSDGTATVTASNGAVPYTYAWSTTPAQTDSLAIGLTAGLYIVTVTDANGCTISNSTTINEPPLITVTTASTNVSCHAGTDGTITVTNTTAGTAAVQYSIDTGTTWQATNTFTNLLAGDYTISTQFVNGTCTITSPSITITEPTPVVLSNTTTDATCNSSADGTATVTPTGGTAGYTYAWDANAFNQTNATAIGLNQGNFEVTVTDANGCTAMDTATVNVPFPIVLTMASTDLSCFGASDGTATVSATGGNGTYTYVWNTTPAQTTQTASNLSAGTTIVTVTDGNGCFDTAQVQITGQVVMTIGFTTNDVSCNNGNDGDATVNITNGNAPFTYIWSDGQSTQTATGLTVGTIVCNISDAIGCLGIDSTIINEPTALVTTMDSVSLLCFEDSTGSAYVTVSGGTSTYTYLWDANANNQTTDTASNLMAGIYFVTITDANGCTNVDSITVTQPAALVLSLGATAVTCSGGNNGLAYVVASGGTNPYYYTWDDGGNQLTDTAFNLSSNNYLVSVTDANGCEPTDTIFVPEPAPLSISMSATVITCFGANDGTALVNTLGGTTPYSFAWNTTPVQTDSLALGLSAGWAVVTVTDANNCDITDSILITEPAQMMTAVTGTDASCNGLSDGTATVVVTGGTIGYTYSWDGVSGTDTTNNLAAGWHYVVVTDGTGCTTLDSILINEPAPIVLTISMTSVLCSGGIDGTATVTATGGAGGFSYQWNTTPVQFTATATALATGTYDVTVTDMNGCINTSTIQVTTPNPLTTTLTPTNVGCFGSVTGSITNSVGGGVPNYTFAWSNGEVTQNLVAVPAGTYTVTITDVNGCNIIDTATVTQPTTPVVININGVDVVCHGGNNGTATATVTGGTTPYQYSWNTIPQQVTAMASGLSVGTYTLSVTDASNCIQTQTVTIQEPSNITAIITEQSSNCFGAGDGSATIAAGGGTPGYTYSWNTVPVQTGATATNLIGGQSYSVVITDTLGCTQSQNITISQPTDITLTTVQTDITCSGFTDGTATISATGGTPGYTFVWDANANNQITATATSLGLGSYDVTVTDVNGCTASTSITIIEPNPLFINTRTVDVNCKRRSTGAAFAIFSGGTAPYSSVWDFNNTVGNSIENVPAGTYYLTVTDANNCQLSDSVIVTEPAIALSLTTQITDNLCYDDRDGEIKITGVGGTAPYVYSLTGQSYSNSTRFVGLLAGDYGVYIKDTRGCSFADSITITEPAAFTVDAIADLNIVFGDAAVLGVTPTNGINPITYAWTPAQHLSCDSCLTPIADSLASDTYFEVFAIDANGCEAESSMYVRVSTPRYVFIANGFTPNNDGNNDRLYIQGGSGTLEVESFKIFDRWGELIFLTENTPLNDASFGWDGTYKGQPMNSGMFLWMVDVAFEDGRVVTYKGSTFLIR